MFSRGNPMTSTVLAVLVFEAIVVGLAIPGIILVEHLPATTASLWCGLGIALCLLGAALLRRPPLGWICAWAAQVVAVGLGFLTPMMFFVGALFALLFAACVVLGRRLDARSAG